MTNKKIALVTGAMGGIGLSICKHLDAEGYVVIGLYHKKYSLEGWVTQFNPANLFQCDINDEAACVEVINKILITYGTLDILVNVAGVTRDVMFKKMSSLDWNYVITTNLTSLYNITQPVFNQMVSNKYGRIVNISSVNGHKGQFGQVNYATAKAGIYGFTKSLALEGALKGVTVNSISPGYIHTAMTDVVPSNVLDSIKAQIPLGKLGKPEDIARTVLFLVDEKSYYITGEDINVNGGLYMV